MKKNVSAVRFKFRCNILISGKIIKEMPGSVASGTHCISAIRMYLDFSTAGIRDWPDGQLPAGPTNYKRP